MRQTVGRKGVAPQDRTEPIHLWDELQHGTIEESTVGPDLWDTLEQRADPSLKKPKQATNVEVARQNDSKGKEYYVLGNPDVDSYLEVDAREYYLWQLMDGEHTVRDLAVLYFQKFSAFPFNRLVQLLGQLRSHHLLQGGQVDLFSTLEERSVAHTLAHRLEQFSEKATQREFSMKNADGFFTSIYRHGGWLLFTRPALAIYCLVMVTGLAFFVAELRAGTYPLFSTAGSLGLGLIVLSVLSYIMTFFHECGHALTCKHYGRRVPKGGLLLYMGAPAFFVDTSDIWMAPKRARVLVSLAGPVTTLLLGSLLALVTGLFPSFAWNGILFKAALMGYVNGLINLCPLLELDGYFVLVDWLEIPLLRKKSLAFVGGPLFKKLFQRRDEFTREERIYAAFGILTAAWTVLTIAMAIYFWQRELGKMVPQLLKGQDILSLVLVGGLMLLAGGNLVLGLGIKGLLLADRGVVRTRRFVEDHWGWAR